MSQWQSLTANISPVQPSRRSEVEGFDARSRTSSTTSFSLGEYHWTIEASAIILSISSMVVILILLPVYENEPLSSWTLPVSFNVIISVLGSTSRAALAFAISACVSQGKWNWYRKRSDNVMIFDRFEEASRGPWGSLRLLWWTKVRHWTALGALSAVFLVVFEPFLQAVVTFSGEELVLVGTANTTGIGRTQNLRSGSWIKTNFRGILSDEGSTMGAIEFDSVRPNYDFDALSAICEGFSNLSTTDNHKPAFTCSTVNCTWPVYASLAVCRGCDDVSSHITRFSGNAPLDNDTIFSTSYGFSGRSSGLASYTGYEIKSQNLEMTKPNGLISEWLPYGETRRAELATQSTCNPGKTVSFHHLKTLIISFSMLKVSPSYLNNSQRWESTAVTAKECALYFCTNIYRSVVEQTVLKEAVLGSYSNRNLDSYNIGADLTRSRVLNHVLNHSLYVEDEDLMASGWDRKWRGLISSEEIPAATPMLWDTDLQLLISGEEYLAATGVNQKGDLRFNITRETTYTLLRWFRDEFSRRRNLATKQLIYPIPYSDVTQPPVINALGTSPNLTRTFDNVAASLTKWIRNRSLQTEPFIGESTEWVVRIRVNWEFLILPIGVLLGGCVFCVLSIWETRDLGLPAWRGSSLATLAHGLDMDSRSLLREAGDGANITDRARSLRVRFVDSEGGPELAHGPEKTRVD
ncbi:hypothetical protein GCG54_00004710 [Colletotrichum gloeosporioides]|uniref:Uncharacterized protein n=1 Tax=Colletotrichum gloeosporioides TaxID=474922 RepID=A0A8H4FJR5_COLGL|nr:uncharacterized protein GCG54_00004710 [Colletotrichum gloeosporioides]KAF3803539.1 hypothetical protein GCG54_00004710 [Colletotrichum gloeosporioides]